jgi:hypothetical protein
MKEQKQSGTWKQKRPKKRIKRNLPKATPIQPPAQSRPQQLVPPVVTEVSTETDYCRPSQYLADLDRPSKYLAYLANLDPPTKRNQPSASKPNRRRPANRTAAVRKAPALTAKNALGTSKHVKVSKNERQAAPTRSLPKPPVEQKNRLSAPRFSSQRRSPSPRRPQPPTKSLPVPPQKKDASPRRSQHVSTAGGERKLPKVKKIKK